MTTIQNISNEFDAMIPTIAADYTAWVTRQCERFTAMEPKELQALPHSWSQQGGMFRQLRHFLTAVDADGNPTNRVSYRFVVDHARIAKKATEYATFQVESFKAKLEAKLVDLTNVRDVHISGVNFTFNGDLGAHKVHVEQTTVLKCSNKGTLFNQWPCRIYLDGKFISEAAFKKLAK